MRKVIPLIPMAPYVGGKSRLAATVIRSIEGLPHTTYVDTFSGMGGIFFRRKIAPKCEVINDKSNDICNLFRVVQRHDEALRDTLKWHLASRSEFKRQLAQDPATLTDIERAARFLYLQNLTFGGKVVGRSFGISAGMPARFNADKLDVIITEFRDRLRKVTIECLDWRDLIKKWDRPRTLFYLDPPYFGTHHYYGRDLFADDDYEELACTLRSIKGRFVMSINDHPRIRRNFSGFEIREAKLKYTLQGRGNQKAASELIISG